jgi:hypothetical protein
MSTEEIHIPRKYFIERGGFTQPDLTTFLKRNDITCNSDGFYPVMRIVEALNSERKKKRFDSDGDDDLEIELKREKIQKERIINQQRLGRLIERDRAKERVRIAFSAVANKIRYSIKLVTPKLVQYVWAVKNSEIQEPSAREIEALLSNEYNGAIELLYSEVNNVTWEQDGSEVKLRRTELAEDSGESVTSTGSTEDTSTAEE